MKKILLLILMAPFLVFAAETTVILSVPTMNCPVCPITVKKSLEGINGVFDIQVSLNDKEAIVTFDDRQTNITELKNATTNAGYPSIEKK